MTRFIFTLALVALFANGCADAVDSARARADRGLSRERLARLDAGMQRYIDAGVVPGALSMVYRRGKLVHFDVRGFADRETQKPLARDTLFRIYSMTKPITSVAVMQLVEAGALRLSDPVVRWLPEFSKLRALRKPDGALDDTVPLARAITVRDLLTHTSGLAYDFTARGPLQAAMREAGLDGGSAGTPEEFMRALGELPLMFQPGTRWHYGLSTDVLGVLVARVAQQPFGEYLREHIFEPLGMHDTAFFVPEEKRARLAVGYVRNPETNELHVYDHPEKTSFAEPPRFESGGGGLVASADDYLRFARMLLAGGELDGVRVLSRKSVERMTVNSLTPEEKSLEGLSDAFARAYRGNSFGLGMRVLEDHGQSATIASVGTHGWGGAAGTWYFVDPTEELIGLLMVQVARLDDENSPIRQDFGTLVYQAIAD